MSKAWMNRNSFETLRREFRADFMNSVSVGGRGGTRLTRVKHEGGTP